MQGSPLALQACRDFPQFWPSSLAHMGMLDSPLDTALRSEKQFVVGLCFSLLTAVSVQMVVTLGSLLDWKRHKITDWRSDSSGLDISLISMSYSLAESENWPALLGACTPGCFRQHSTLSPTLQRNTDIVTYTPSWHLGQRQ